MGNAPSRVGTPGADAWTYKPALADDISNIPDPRRASSASMVLDKKAQNRFSLDPSRLASLPRRLARSEPTLAPPSEPEHPQVYPREPIKQPYNPQHRHTLHDLSVARTRAHSTTDSVFADLPLLQPSTSSDQSSDSEASLSPHNSLISRFRSGPAVANDAFLINQSPNPSFQASVYSPDFTYSQDPPSPGTLYSRGRSISVSPANSLRRNGTMRRVASVRSNHELDKLDPNDFDAGIPPEVPPHRILVSRRPTIRVVPTHKRTKSSGSDVMPLGIYTRKCSYVRHETRAEAKLAAEPAAEPAPVEEPVQPRKPSTTKAQDGARDTFILDGYGEGTKLRVINVDLPEPESEDEEDDQSMDWQERNRRTERTAYLGNYSPDVNVPSPIVSKYLVPSKAMLAEQQERHLAAEFIADVDSFEFF